MSSGAPWPPSVGELLLRGTEAIGVRYKLENYCLDIAHKDGRPKAMGFQLMLGITIDDVDYLAEAIEAGILVVPIDAVRDNTPYGFNCVVDLPIRGIGTKADRVIDVRTAWEITGADAPPRLVSAYPNP